MNFHSIACSIKLSRYGSDFVEDPALHRSIVGEVQHVTVTKPSSGSLILFLEMKFVNLCHSHELQPASAMSPLSLKASCDTDWAYDVDDRKSTSGAFVFFGQNLISWWAKKQTPVAESGKEAEYLAASEILWIQYLFRELQIQIPAPIIFFDN